MNLPARLKRQLASRARTELRDELTIPCAVLVPILAQEHGYGVLYTLRSEDLPSHRGQVSFPGGKRAASDSTLLETALRETHEEVGIEPESVEVLGLLDDVYTLATPYRITPFVGLLAPACRLAPNPREVRDVFCVPLVDIVNPVYHKIEARRFEGREYPVEILSAGPHKVWGATYKITTNLIKCLREVLA